MQQANTLTLYEGLTWKDWHYYQIVELKPGRYNTVPKTVKVQDVCGVFGRTCSRNQVIERVKVQSLADTHIQEKMVK